MEEDKVAMLPIGELFDQTNKILQRHWKPLILISVIYAVMAIIIDITTSILLDVVFIFSTFFVTITLVVAMKNLEEPVIISKSIKEGSKLFIPYTLLAVIYGLILGAGFVILTLALYGASITVGWLILIVPIIILAVWLSLFEYTMVFEDQRFLKAFSRSKTLVEGYSFDVFNRFIIFICIWFVIYLILSKIPYVGSTLIDLLFFPHITVYFFVIYKDLSRIKGSIK